jgi:cell division protein FtsI (penicillin-binding protein 3)
VVFLLTLFAVVGGRLMWLQLVEAKAYAKAAEAQRTQEIVLTPRRGAILDREGQPLAISVDAKTVFATPRTIKDPKAVAVALAKYLGGDEATYLKRVTRKSAFVYIERKVPLERVKPLMDAKVEGLGFADDSRRVYPCGDLACQILGFVGVDDRGLAGLELYYNDVLGGKAGRQLAERDAYGNPIPGGVKVSEDPVDGKDIVLTIDKDIQYQTQLELAATVKKYGAKGGWVVIMDPRSGEIYAMASTPTFDPNDYQHAAAAAVRNRPILDTYEPGSTIKAMTASAVIDKGIFTPRSMFHLPPTITVGGRVIHEAHDRGSVDWNLTQIVTQSSNIGAVKLGQALGPGPLSDYFGRFGLLERTGVDFPGEAKGWMPPTDSWSASTIGNVPFGQGVSVTELQLARAIAGIADRGELVTPHFLSGVRGDNSMKVTFTTKRAVSPKTALTMTNVLAQVVKDGTGKEAAVNGYQVAGKTGTAQKAIPGGGGYAAGAYIASFAGFLPAEDPKVLIIVTIDEPQGTIYGGSVAAPLFSSLAGYTVGHLKIPPPSRTEPVVKSRKRRTTAAAAWAKAAGEASGAAGNAPATGAAGSGSP